MVFVDTYIITEGNEFVAHFLFTQLYRLNLPSIIFEKAMNLADNQEDDVRETCVKVMRDFYDISIIQGKFEKLFNDCNCHVRYQARITSKMLQEKLESERT